jgi:hypothetical protein
MDENEQWSIVDRGLPIADVVQFLAIAELEKSMTEAGNWSLGQVPESITG